ncbi:MAG: GatB/YqeY domain-containing protein, partial [Candidatus Lokiarchaeota archaeon]|nr:GatB/YqeY domain-containing protein [Candidatus Lokiarchaeota archaeon]
NLTIAQLIEKLHFETLSVEDLKIIINEIVNKSSKIIKEREMRSIGPLMGEVMEKVRGKIDGEIVSKELKIQISNKLKEMK